MMFLKTHVMMRLRDATLRATIANKVALEAKQGKDAAEKEKEDLQRELCGKRPQPEASTIEANEEMPMVKPGSWVCVQSHNPW